MNTVASSAARSATALRRATTPYSLSVLAALTLAACGGGGGADPASSTMTATPSSPSSTAVVGSTVTPTSTTTAPSAVQVTGNLKAQPNTHYEVSASGAVDIVLPTSHLLQVGDVVSVRGTGTGAWRLVPGWLDTVTARARTAPFYLATGALAGNAAPGERWTTRLEARAWQAVASEPEGSVLVAADGAGQLHVSNDAGETWTTGNSPAANWVAVSATRMTWTNPSGAAGQVLLAAAAQGGGLYRSTGDGNWTAVTAASGANVSNQDWAAVDISEGGSITAAVFNGPILGGPALAPATAQGSGTVLVRGWRGLARGAGTLAAVNQEGEVHVSLDGGLTFAQRNVTIDGVAVNTPWHRVAVSRDGRTLAVAGRAASSLYLSRDAGLTWTRSAAPSGDYTALALSGDGQVVGAALAAAGVQLSTDGGASFRGLAMPEGSADWRAFSLSDDGKQLIAASRGATGTGQLVTSLGDRTAYASGKGAVTGGPGDFVEVEYLGNLRYQVRQSSGGPFTIR